MKILNLKNMKPKKNLSNKVFFIYLAVLYAVILLVLFGVITLNSSPRQTSSHANWTWNMSLQPFDTLYVKKSAKIVLTPSDDYSITSLGGLSYVENNGVLYLKSDNVNVKLPHDVVVKIAPGVNVKMSYGLSDLYLIAGQNSSVSVISDSLANAKIQANDAQVNLQVKSLMSLNLYLRQSNLSVMTSSQLQDLSGFADNTSSIQILSHVVNNRLRGGASLVISK